MIDKITVESGKTLEEKIYVCDECLTLLTLQGNLKNTFIVRIESREKIECNICGAEAKFVLSPFKRGIWVCQNCLEERGKKHVWMRLKIVNYSDKSKCDICLAEGAYLLIKES